MSTPEKSVLDRMVAAFGAQDAHAAAATVTDDSVWIHHGTQKLPSMRFEGKAAVTKFFEINFTTMSVEQFEVLSMVQEGDVVAVFGREKFTMSNAEGDFTQKWVQVYTFRDGLIARMEEYATSAPESDYNVITE